ncbi:exodeoxyribonuclease V subunit gamma [Acinetobacter sp. ANC 3791]|uniref:exodeoxyribonuclease V subunit gamma n=1 Tax=Acinetobacter sp. ANC 3791 TaxID=2529836 RepID=UPI0010408525|nr:exodeoxyribonuclease V subunit gamma [Acinetobacter sp. ANC 3791]TCB84523.1 exonuclease V subunit gamma [Acinetobacter sp. ANC 3791]
MGIHVCQSQRLELLLQTLLAQISQAESHPLQVLQQQHFVVPSAAVEQWLQQQISQYQGISANQLYHQRIQTFQWYAYQQVLENKEQVRQANIPRLVMQWRIYEALKPYIEPEQLSLAAEHPLYSIVQRIYDSAAHLTQGLQQQLKKQNMLYWVSEQVSRVFSHYMVYRGQCQHHWHEPCGCPQNWLKAWGNNRELDIEQLFQADEHGIALYQLEQVQQLEAWQRWLWQEVFHADFVQMQQIDRDFWAILDDPEQRKAALKRLPQQLLIFTVLDLPPTQLQFLRRLGQYLDVVILHYNPSQEYWADSVDPNWKKRYDLGVKQRFLQKHPQASDADLQRFFDEFTLNFNAEARESRHPLLTRFGKQARDHFSLLSHLSSGEEGQWLDLFDEDYSESLLGKIQSDVLYLMEPEKHQFELSPDDQSIQVHVCHSALRQLEVLKDQLLHWLAQGTAEQPRRLDDILVLTPDIKALEPHIRSVFAPPPRVQNSQQAPYLPVKIGGVAQLDMRQAWQAVCDRIQLPHGRFQFEQFADWLSLPATQQRYALDTSQTQRALQLLTQAGFKRGLDEAHLARQLSPEDRDYRFSFKFALDRLALGVAIPEHVLFEGTLSYAQVLSSDFELIATLIDIYEDLAQRRDWLILHELGQNHTVEHWLYQIQQDIHEFQQAGVTALGAAYDMVRKHIRMLTLSVHYQKQQHSPQVALQDFSLPLGVVLQEIQQQLDSQFDQAEPSGQITFSQIGQIRPLPYRLVVMLNLDSGKFPNRKTHTPFDLMQSLRPQLGDRSRLEDDQGAFLDALLLAKEQLWLFYNGFDISDGEVRQPSSVLQELLDHIGYIVASEQPDAEIDATVEYAGLEIPQHVLSLYRVHPLQPFDLKGFTAEYLRYQDQWFTVAQQIQQATGQRQPWSNQTYTVSETDVIMLSSQQWLNDMVFPAQLYLKTLGVENLRMQDLPDEVEPLLLDGLGRYSLREFLQQQDAASTELLQDRLPVGKTQHSAWQLGQLEHQQLLTQLQQYAAVPTETTGQTLHLRDKLHMRIVIPKQPQQDWVSLNPSSARAERRAKTWLEYLLWLAYLNLEEQGKQLKRIVVFSNSTLICEGLSSVQAKAYLDEWLKAWDYGQTSPLVLPAALLLKPLETGKTLEWQADEQSNMHIVEPEKNLLKQWQGGGNFNSIFSIHEDRSTQYHDDWQFILQEQDADLLLRDACQRFAYRLYAPIYQYQRAVEHA